MDAPNFFARFEKLMKISFNLIRVVFIFRHPENVDALKVFLSPFEQKVWCLILLTALMIVFGMHGAFKLEMEKFVQDQLNEIGNDRSYSNCIIIVFGYLFQQGGKSDYRNKMNLKSKKYSGYSGVPLLISSRLFTFTILLFSIMIYQFYGSFIVGSLLTDSPNTITTVKRLLESNLYTYVDEVPYILDNFKRVKEKSAVQLFNKVMAQSNVFIPVSKGVMVIKRGDVFHTDASYTYLLLKCKILSQLQFGIQLSIILAVLTDHEICSLQEIQYQEKLQCGPGLPVKSHLREWIKVSIRKIQETGLMAYNWKIWMGHKPKCENNDLDVIPVDIVHFSSAIYGLAIGMQISFGFFVAEVIIGRTNLFLK